MVENQKSHRWAAAVGGRTSSCATANAISTSYVVIETSQPPVRRASPREGALKTLHRSVPLAESGIGQGQVGTQYREMFKAAGWEFGASILDVMRCPCCPKDTKPDPDKAALKAGLVEILGDDEDGIATAMEDFGL